MSTDGTTRSAEPADAWIAVLAVRRGLVPADRLEACLAGARTRAEGLPSLASLLVDEGLLSAAQVEDLEDAHDETYHVAEDNEGDSVHTVRLLAASAASESTIEEALRLQARLSDLGVRLRLQDLLPSPCGENRAEDDSPRTCIATPAPSNPSDPTAVPHPRRPGDGAVTQTTFGRYRLLGEIGRGGMGLVYRAWDDALRREVALKLLPAADEASEDAVARFTSEARAAARLRHAHIVPVHDVGCEGGRHYFTMELIEGESLKSAAPRLPLREFLAVLRDAASALHAAHEAGLVHRDVKPANILLDRAGRAFVTDFGLATEIRASGQRGMTRTGAMVGTPAYMSPEQVEGARHGIGPAVDLWALGVILYEKLAGRTPFQGDDPVALAVEIARKDPPPPSRFSRVHRDLETICTACLQKDPRHRYPSAAALAADLGRFLDGEPIEASEIGRFTRLARRALRHRRFVVPLGAAALVALAASVYAVVAGGGRRASEAERDAEQLLTRAEGLWHEAKAVLYRPAVPLSRYQEHLAGAEEIYEEAIRRAPQYGWIYESRGRLRLQAGDLDGAERDLSRAIELLSPAEAKAAHRTLGRVYVERSFEVLASHTLGDPDDGSLSAKSEDLQRRALAEMAASQGEFAWRGTSEEAENARGLAEAFAAFARKDRARAAEVLREGLDLRCDEECAWAIAFLRLGDRAAFVEKALSMRPRFARALALRASDRLLAGEVIRSCEDCDLVVGLCPRSATARINRGAARFKLGRAAEALEDFSEAVRLGTEDPTAWINRGFAREAVHDLQGAEADLDEAIRRAPAYPRARAARALYLTRKGEIARARSDVDEALRLAPGDPRMMCIRAYVRCLSGDRAGAIEDCDGIIRRGGRVSEAFSLRGKARALSGDRVGALADFDEALRLDPNDVTSYRERALLRQRAEDRKGALADYDKALVLSPDHATTLSNRGSLRALEGDIDGALADLDRAVAIDPTAPILMNRGLTLAKKLEWRRALADFDGVIRLSPGDPVGHAHRGRARKELGDVAGAIEDWKHSLEIAPADWPYRAQIEGWIGSAK